MSKKGAAAGLEQVVKLIVGAGQASPSPPVGPALGSKGVKSMDFCKVRSLPFIQLLQGAKGGRCWRRSTDASMIAGVQRENSKLRPRHAHALPRRRPT